MIVLTSGLPGCVHTCGAARLLCESLSDSAGRARTSLVSDDLEDLPQLLDCQGRERIRVEVHGVVADFAKFRQSFDERGAVQRPAELPPAVRIFQYTLVVTHVEIVEGLDRPRPAQLLHVSTILMGIASTIRARTGDCKSMRTYDAFGGFLLAELHEDSIHAVNDGSLGVWRKLAKRVFE